METKPKTNVQKELETKDPGIVSYKNFVYLHEKDKREHLWWGKPGGCSHCRQPLNEKTTTLVSAKNGWGFQRCDFCLVNCVVAYPCDRWSKDKKDFFAREGYINHDLFDKNGKQRLKDKI